MAPTTRPGGCVDGVCSVNNWRGLEWGEPSPLTCADVCDTASFGMTCQAQGCSELELTGFVCETFPGLVGCALIKGQGGDPPLLEFAGSCDEQIPGPEVIEGGYRTVFCCCG